MPRTWHSGSWGYHPSPRVFLGQQPRGFLFNAWQHPPTPPRKKNPGSGAVAQAMANHPPWSVAGPLGLSRISDYARKQRMPWHYASWYCPPFCPSPAWGGTFTCQKGAGVWRMNKSPQHQMFVGAGGAGTQSRVHKINMVQTIGHWWFLHTGLEDIAYFGKGFRGPSAGKGHHQRQK